jgi:hypothetical protein
MIKRIIGFSFISLLLSSTAFADAASGLPTGKRQHSPAAAQQDTDEVATDVKESAMNKAELTATPAEKTPASKAKDNHEDSDSDVMNEMDKAHKPGGGMTGQSRRRGASDEENVTEKTDKSEAARSRKKD